MLINTFIGLAVMVLCLFAQALLVAVAVKYYARHRVAERA